MGWFRMRQNANNVPSLSTDLTRICLQMLHPPLLTRSSKENRSQRLRWRSCSLCSTFVFLSYILIIRRSCRTWERMWEENLAITLWHNEIMVRVCFSASCFTFSLSLILFQRQENNVQRWSVVDEEAVLVRSSSSLSRHLWSALAFKIK